MGIIPWRQMSKPQEPREIARKLIGHRPIRPRVSRIFFDPWTFSYGGRMQNYLNLRGLGEQGSQNQEVQKSMFKNSCFVAVGEVPIYLEDWEACLNLEVPGN